jgi:hypothetical protein
MDEVKIELEAYNDLDADEFISEVSLNSAIAAVGGSGPRFLSRVPDSPLVSWSKLTD